MLPHPTCDPTAVEETFVFAATCIGPLITQEVMQALPLPRRGSERDRRRTVAWSRSDPLHCWHVCGRRQLVELPFFRQVIGTLDLPPALKKQLLEGKNLDSLMVGVAFPAGLMNE